MKLFIATGYLLFFVTGIAYSMPSATRYRINLGFNGGYSFHRDSSVEQSSDDQSAENKTYEGGMTSSVKLEYNRDYNFSWGLESGYMQITYDEEIISIAPAILNFYSDFDYMQGSFVVRFGIGFGYLHIFNNDQEIFKGYTGHVNLSFLFEVASNVYFDISTQYKLIYLEKNTVPDKYDTITLVPVSAGLLFRL